MDTRTPAEIADQYWEARAAHDEDRARTLWRELGEVLDREVESSAWHASIVDVDGSGARAVRAFGMTLGVPVDGRPTWRGSWHAPDGDGYEWWHGVRGAGWIHDGEDDEFPYVVTVHRPGWVLTYCEGDITLQHVRETLEAVAS